MNAPSICNLLAPTVLVACALLVPLAAQGVISDGTASYRIRSIGTAQADSVDCDFSADPAVVGDTLTEQWWYYRVQGDADEAVFRDDGTLSQRYGGRHGDLFWSDVDGRGLFRAHVGLALFRTGQHSARLYNRMTVFNIGAQPIRMSLFHYADVNLCGYANNRARGLGDYHFVVGNCANQMIAVEALAATRYEIGTRDDTECGIRVPGIATLGNCGLPYAGGDYTSAAEWDFVLPVGQQFTAWVSLEHNPGSCPPAQMELYGTGRTGTHGVPVISSGLPRMGTTPTVSVTNTLPNTVGILAFGFGRAEFPLGPLQLQVLGGPRGIDFDSLVVVSDPAGRIDLRVPIPPLEEFCTKQINWQCFLLDAGAPAPLPFSQTRALEWLIGG